MNEMRATRPYCGRLCQEWPFTSMPQCYGLQGALKTVLRMDTFCLWLMFSDICLKTLVSS